MEDSFILNIPPWPEYVSSNYRYFVEGEKHVTRFCKEFVLIFMLEGTLSFTENGIDINLHPGEWYIQQPDLLQEGRVGCPSPVYYYTHFRAFSNNIEQIENKVSLEENSSKLTFNIKGKFEPYTMKPLLDNLEYLSKTGAKDSIGIQIYFLKILHAIDFGRPVSMLKDSLSTRIAEFLHQNYNKPITSEILSNELHFTSDYIIRKFKQNTGSTPWQYVQRLRLEKAKEMLSNTDYPMEFISREIGYSDLSLFYKAFKKSNKISPGKWRIRERGI